jgi:hypothetical protein
MNRFTSFLVAAALTTVLTLPAHALGTYKFITEQGIELGYHVNGTILEARVVCPTSGWASVGFEASNMMKDANIIIGYVDAAGQGKIRDDFGDSKKSHKSDEALGGKSDVTLVSATQAGGKTTLEFTIPLVSGDAFDAPLASGKLTHVILGCGKDGKKDFTSMHKIVGATQITLD